MTVNAYNKRLYLCVQRTCLLSRTTHTMRYTRLRNIPIRTFTTMMLIELCVRIGNLQQYLRSFDLYFQRYKTQQEEQNTQKRHNPI